MTITNPAIGYMINGETRVELARIEENTGSEETRTEAIIERFIEADLRRREYIP